MTTLTITHNAAEGTLIEGTERGDGSAPALKANGWRWGRSISTWYVPHSRDRAPKRWVIDRTVKALEGAGFKVEVEVDANPRDQHQVEAMRRGRSTDRTAALQERAAKHEQAADAAYAGVRAIADGIPLSQPILVGHHSEARARRDQDRMHRGMSKAVSEGDYAAELSRRASESAAATGARNTPITVGNRIERLDTELRRANRNLAAYKARGGADDEGYGLRLTELIAHTTSELDYWREIRQEQIDCGEATNYSADSVTTGDLVKINAGWYRVVRANAKTVSVQTPTEGPTATPGTRSPAIKQPSRRPVRAVRLKASAALTGTALICRLQSVAGLPSLR